VFFSKRFEKLVPYVPGEQPRGQEYIKLNTNESPFPPSRKVINALNCAETSLLNRYSDPSAKALVDALTGYYGLPTGSVFVSNGSDESLAFIFDAFCDGKRGMVFPDITYGFYPVFAAFFGLKYRTVPLDENYRISVNDYKDISDNVIIANPNAQTGIYLEKSEIERLVSQRNDRLVIIDEAYIDFGGESAISLLPKYDNLIIVQTFSKSRNLAGARIGMAFASPEIINDLNTLRNSFNPYNLDRLAIIAGTEAVKDTEYFKKCTAEIISIRESTVKSLRALGFEILPSRANFIMAKCNRISGKELYLTLKERGILVRHFDDIRISDFVRVTIGGREQMDALVKECAKIIEERKKII